MAKDPFKELEKDDPFAAADGLFDRPNTNFEQLASDENKGKLVLATPTQFLEKVPTRFTKPGETPPDAVEVDAVVFEEDGSHTELLSTRIFARVIVGQLKGRVGKNMPPVLGVLTQVKSSKGHDAWIIDPDKVTTEQIKLAKQYLLDSQKVDVGA